MNQLSTEFTHGDYRYSLVERVGTVALYKRVHVTQCNTHYEAVILTREQYPDEASLGTHLFRDGNPQVARQEYTRLVAEAAAGVGVFAVPKQRARKKTTTRP